jgi:hypothetical protein
MRFKPGQEVVCVISPNRWIGSASGRNFYGPKFGEIVTVSGYSPDNNNYVGFEEYDDLTNGYKNYYNERAFEPVVSDSELQEAIKECELIEV